MLTITRYLDLSPRDVTDRLADVVARTQAPANAEIRVSGIDQLTTVEVTVPWSTEQREVTALAADRFATALTTELTAA